MVAKRIRCIVVEIPVTADTQPQPLEPAFESALREYVLRQVDADAPLPTEETLPQPRFSARDMVPWADPYIQRVIHNLQDEVRRERSMALPPREEKLDLDDIDFDELPLRDILSAEALPPLSDSPIHFESPDEDDLWRPRPR